MRMIYLATVLTVLAAVPAAGQQPPRVTPLQLANIRLSMPVLVREPTLVLLVTHDTTLASDASAEARRAKAAFDSALAQAQGVAMPLRYHLEVRYSAGLRVVDLHGNAVYDSPADRFVGYVIIMPMERPRVVKGLLSPTALRAAIEDYQRILRPLAS